MDRIKHLLPFGDADRRRLFLATSGDGPRQKNLGRRKQNDVYRERCEQMKTTLPIGWESWPAQAQYEYLLRLKAVNDRGKGDKFKRKYRNNRVAFVHDCIEWPEGQKPASYQDDIFAAMDQHNRVAVRGPHGIGKTAIAAL